MSLLARLVKEEEGQGLVEYALIIALIAVAAVAAITLLGGKIRDLFNNTADKIPS